jgi:hypothetical protein
MRLQVLKTGALAAVAASIVWVSAAYAQLFGKAEPKGVPYQQVADMLHAVMAADRTVYTVRVVSSGSAPRKPPRKQKTSPTRCSRCGP